MITVFRYMKAFMLLDKIGKCLSVTNVIEVIDTPPYFACKK